MYYKYNEGKSILLTELALNTKGHELIRKAKNNNTAFFKKEYGELNIDCVCLEIVPKEELLKADHLGLILNTRSKVIIINNKESLKEYSKALISFMNTGLSKCKYKIIGGTNSTYTSLKIKLEKKHQVGYNLPTF